MNKKDQSRLTRFYAEAALRYYGIDALLLGDPEDRLSGTLELARRAALPPVGIHSRHAIASLFVNNHPADHAAIARRMRAFNPAVTDDFIKDCLKELRNDGLNKSFGELPESIPAVKRDLDAA